VGIFSPLDFDVFEVPGVSLEVLEEI